MTLICPECDGRGFQIIDAVECGRSPGVDENTIQRAFCRDCDTRFLCSYTEKRDYVTGRDRASHNAWVADADHWGRIASAFEKPTRQKSSPDRVKAASAALSVYTSKDSRVPVIYKAITQEPLDAQVPRFASPRAKSFLGRFLCWLNW